MNFVANPIFVDFTELCIYCMKWWWISLFRCESICELDSITCNLSPIWPSSPLFRSCGLSIRGTFCQVCQAGKLTASSKLSLLPTPSPLCFFFFFLNPKQVYLGFLFRGHLYSLCSMLTTARFLYTSLVRGAMQGAQHSVFQCG